MIKTHKMHVLVLFTALFIASCGSETAENPSDGGGPAAPASSNTESAATTGSSVKTYAPTGDCEALIQSFDLSSLCFTDEKIPEYRVESAGERACQFEFTPTDYTNDIHMSITYSDYENSIFASEDDPDMPRVMFEETFKKKRNSQMFYTKSTDVADLGDDAFIGYNENRNEKALCVRVSNVSFTIQLNQTHEKTTCLLTDEELVKFGRIVVDKIKK
jgi:hypothetical protein